MFENIDLKVKSLNAFVLSSNFHGGKIHGHIKNTKNIGFIEIITEDGTKGYSENYLAVYSPDIFKVTVKFLQSKIIGKKIKDINFFNLENFIPFIGRNGFIKSILGSIEIALIDLIGKILKIPSYKIFSNKTKNIECYYSGGSVVMSPKEIVKDIEKAIKNGFSSYKMRIGFQSWIKDQERILYAKKILGDKKNFIIDAIMGTHKNIWKINEAIKKIRYLEKFNLMWIEEPLHPDDINGYKELKKKIKVPIAAGEAYTGNLEYETIINTNSLSYLQLDVTSSGGYSFCKKILKFANAKNIRVVPHCWGTDAAISANLLFASTNYLNVKIFEIPSIKLDISKYISEGSFELKGGYIAPTSINGLGIKISDKVKSKFKYKKVSTFSI
tara:strand:+ start:424 stop:1578 length:1155 start_codon:yes stop_codon:yes gene_type:complete